MKFLTKKDLYTSITEDSLDEITDCKDYILDECENRSIEAIKEFLRARYDIDYELRSYVIDDSSGSVLNEMQRVNNDDVITVHSSSGILIDDRNYSLKTIACDIFKYELYQSVAPKQISPVVVDRYDRAIEKLTNINKGMLNMNLKEIVKTDENTYTAFRFGNSTHANKYKW